MHETNMLCRTTTARYRARTFTPATTADKYFCSDKLLRPFNALPPKFEEKLSLVPYYVR